jgi:hypothetical protein
MKSRANNELFQWDLQSGDLNQYFNTSILQFFNSSKDIESWILISPSIRQTDHQIEKRLELGMQQHR